VDVRFETVRALPSKGREAFFLAPEVSSLLERLEASKTTNALAAAATEDLLVGELEDTDAKADVAISLATNR